MNDNALSRVVLTGAQTLGPWRARTHSIFDKAINIISGEKRFTLLFNPLWISENNLVLSDRAIISLIDRASCLSSDGKFLYLNGTPIADYNRSTVWRMPEIPYSPVLPECLGRIEAFITQSEPNRILRYIENRFIEAIRSFADGQSADFAAIVGAGPGLTPSGDDMLVGFALAVHYCSPDLLPKLADVCSPLLNNTTDVSRYLLADALNGRFIAPLVKLLAAMKSGRNFDNALSVAANIGSSSGRDGIFGLYHGLKLFNAG